LASRKSILLRLSPELWEELNRLAAQEFRSLNGQIEYLLHRAVRHAQRVDRPRPMQATISPAQGEEGAEEESGP